MAFDPLTAILTLGNTVLDRILPDKTANDAAKAQLLSLQVSGELASNIAQAQIDQTEAANQSIFVAGWRPWLGWICGTAFAYAYVIQPLVITILVACHSTFDASKMPKLDMTEMMPVLLGMLGLGAMRSYDKSQGTGNGH